MATATPPGPKGRPLTGNLLDYARDPLPFLLRCARNYGDVVSLRFPGPPVCLLSSPEDIKRVLLTENHNFVKDRVTRRDLSILGNGLLLSENPFWRQQRRIAQPAFHRERIAGYAAEMVAATERMLRGWRAGEVRDIHREMTYLTLEVVSKTLIGTDLSGESERIGRALGAVMARASDRGASPWLRLLPESLPTPSNLRYRRALRDLDAAIRRIIEARRYNDGNGDDLLSMLMDARYEDGSKMSEDQLRDETMTFVMAGHETTAVALSWTWHLLGTNPEVERRLHAELDEVLDDRPPAFGDLPHLRYTDAVLKESMRLYPPAWSIGREPKRDCEIGGYHIPARTQLFISQYVVHRHPRHFENPDAFTPERWLGGLEKRLPRYTYFPFGGGPRQCIGNAFAKTEAALVLATAARRFRLEPAYHHPPIPEPSITLRPAGGLKMRLVER